MRVEPVSMGYGSGYTSWQRSSNLSIMSPAFTDASVMSSLIDSVSLVKTSKNVMGGISKVFDMLLDIYDSVIAQLTAQEEKIYDPNYLYNFLNYPDDKLLKLARSIVDQNDTNDEKALKITKWVHDNFPYITDDENYGLDEFWAPPLLALATGSGDCVANYEEIWTINGLKKVGDLEVGNLVLSYDFDKKDFVYRPVTKIWEKGELDIYRVHFRNGTWIDVTEDHPFWTRQHQSGSTYEKTKLCDIDLNCWWKRKIPCVKKLPYVAKDVEWLEEDLCFVIGHFLAEGSTKHRGVETSGYDILDSIIPILDKHEIPYSFRTNNSGVPCIRFLKSNFKEYIRGLVESSFEINMYEELLTLPENKLEALLEGIFVGDGHHSKYSDKRGYKNNKERVYSTSSDQLAKDIQRMHLQLGKPVYMWLQKDHKGAGDKPIWRLSYNSNSVFSRDFGYTNASEVSIKKIEPIGKTVTRDFEVLDTHTFVTEFGNILHQCEDGAFLVHSLMLHAGVPYERLRTYGGIVQVGIGAATGGHGWTAYRRESDNQWVVLDTSYYINDLPVRERPLMKDDRRYIDDFFYFNVYYYVVTDKVNRVRDPDGSANAYVNYNMFGYGLYESKRISIHVSTSV